jgi:anti-sigma-K factor RskA
VLAAAAAVVVLAGGVGFVAGRRAPATAGVAGRAEAALADPDSVQAALTDAGGREVARVVAGADSGYVVLDGLDRLPASQTYQLWDLQGASPVSLGLLGDGAAPAVAVRLPPGPVRLSITAEPGTGASSPTGPIVARGVLAAKAAPRPRPTSARIGVR